MTSKRSTSRWRWRSRPNYGDIVINEVLYEQRPGFTEEFVELYNASAGPIDLTGWNLASQNNPAGDPVDIDYVIPGVDELVRPAILPAGGYAVIWIQTRGGTEVAPLAALEFAVNAPLIVDNDGEEIFIFDASGAVVDYMDYGDRLNALADFGTAPPAAIWDDTYSAANQIASGPGVSISLTASGVDTDQSACWEATGSGDASGRAECTGAPITIDADATGRAASPGVDNNTIFTNGLVISEYAAAGVNSSGDFVEIHNSSNTNRLLDGITLHISDDSTELSSVTIATPGVTLAPGEFYLLAESATALASSADALFGAGLPLSVGLELRTGGGAVIDAVGTRASPELTIGPFLTDSVFGEGVHLPAFDLLSSISQSFSRMTISGGVCQDTDNNSADFIHNFTAGMVSPRNLASGSGPCSPPQPPLTKTESSGHK